MYFRRFTSGNASQVFNHDKYLTIEALEDIFITVTGNFPTAMFVKTGNGEWLVLQKYSGFEINKGECVYFKSDITIDSMVTIRVNGRFRVKGNYMSLMYMDNADRYDKVSTTLASYCYSNMFYGCTSLVNAPELPATTLASRCYSNMFYGCTSLVNAPELPATTLASYCYSYMFYNCSHLNYIKMLAKIYLGRDSFLNWVYGVSTTGTFVKHPEATWDVRGVNGIPEGWTVKTE